MKIRVTCPACHDTLEVDDEHIGKEVECGSCLQPFTVADPAAKKPKKYKMRRSESEYADEEPAARPPAFRRRPKERDDPDEERYDEPPRRPSATGLGVVALLCGLLALLGFCCPLSVPLGVIAMVCGHIGKRNPSDRQAAVAGSVIGSVAVLACVGFWVYVMTAGAGKVPWPGR
jgi:predicted Zn finger-like uncharacterized protein